jgi:MFS family permease
VGALLSGLTAGFVITMFGEDNWRYVFFVPFMVAVPLMLFWSRYSTADKIATLYTDIAQKNMTPPDTGAASGTQKGQGWRALKATLANRTITLTAANTMFAQAAYMGVNIVLPAYLYNIVGLSLAESAGMSVVFTITGILGQLLWPSLSDIIGRKITLVICGIWMAFSIAAFYFASTILSIIIIQLFFGLVANAVWPIFYAVASDSAEPGATSTANGVITTALFVGGGLAPVVMGALIGLGGGWHSLTGYVICFFFMAGCAIAGVALQLCTSSRIPTLSEAEFA